MQTYDFRTQPALLIQGAMDTETAYLIANLAEKECVSIGNWDFYTGFLGKHREPVIVSKTYQGMTNAAAAASLAMVSFSPWAVINQGIGGGHDPKFHVGDIVLGEKVVPMGAVVRGFSPSGAGIDETDFSPWALEIFDRKDGCRKVSEFLCDKELLAAAERVEFDRKTRCGVLASADEWNNQLDRIALLRERYGTSEEDMESAATAQICMSYGVPFIGIRILSNTIVNGEEFDEAVALDGQKFIVSYVEELHECPHKFRRIS